MDLSKSGATRQARALSARLLVICAITFLVVLAIRLWYVNHYAVALPYWDQWDSEGDGLLRQWIEGTFQVSQLWKPHSEHRILPSRVLSIALYELTGQWNNLYAARFNVFLASCSAALLAAIVIRDRPVMGPRWLLMPVVLAAFVLPFGWENFLVGFQSAFYFLVFFTIASIGLAALRPDSTLANVAVIALGMVSAVTLGSGFLTPLVAATMYVLGGYCRRSYSRRDYLNIAALMIIFAVALINRSHNPGHDRLQATGAFEFIDAMNHLMGWPIIRYHWAVTVFWLPSTIAVLILLWRRSLLGTDLLMAGFLAWTVAQCLAVTYSRGHNMIEITSRYADLLTLGIVANAWFAIRLAEMSTASQRLGVATKALAAVFFGCLLYGHVARFQLDAVAMKERHDLAEIQTVNVNRYLQTGDPKALLQPFQHIPYPNPSRLKALLDNPALRSALPDLRPASEIENDNKTPAALPAPK